MNLTKTIKIAALCTLPLILTACGGDDSSSNTEAWFKSAPTELEGTWIDSCRVNGNHSQKTTGTVTGNKNSLQVIAYNDKQCHEPILLTKTTFMISIGKVTGNEFTDIDMVLKRTEMALSTAETATNANNASMFGLNNWKENSFVDISNNNIWLTDSEYCDGDPECKVGSVGRDIFKVKNNILYFGDETNLDSNNRPIRIDDTDGAKKQIN